jgi:hypothetical protein
VYLDSELVIADRTEAAAFALSDHPCRDWRGINWGVDVIPLASLWLILEGKEAGPDDVVARAQRFELLVEGPEDRPWVQLVPDAVRDLLADLAVADGEKLRTVVLALAGTDEMQCLAVDAVEELVREVAGLADVARRDGMGLLLRIRVYY